MFIGTSSVTTRGGEQREQLPPPPPQPPLPGPLLRSVQIGTKRCSFVGGGGGGSSRVARVGMAVGRGGSSRPSWEGGKCFNVQTKIGRQGPPWLGGAPQVFTIAPLHPPQQGVSYLHDLTKSGPDHHFPIIWTYLGSLLQYFENRRIFGGCASTLKFVCLSYFRFGTISGTVKDKCTHDPIF